MPSALVEAHISMLDRLRAEESMTSALQVATSRLLGGRGRGESLKRAWDVWRRTATQGRRATPATPQALAASGIGIQKVILPRKAAANG